MTTEPVEAPWEVLADLIASSDAEALGTYLDRLGAAETARAVSRLPAENQHRMLEMLRPSDAAEVVQAFPQAQAAGLIEALAPEQAAAIVDEMPLRDQADLLAEIDEVRADAVLQELGHEEAEEVREFMAYPPDTAGGIMVDQFLTYESESTVGDVTADLQANRETYADYSVQYMYVTDGDGRLEGVLRIRDLLFASRSARLSGLMIRDPLVVPVKASLDELKEFFDEHKLYGVPVVDEERSLLGVVRQSAVEAAAGKIAAKQLLEVSGIVGGEEFRSMPLILRSRRRLSWLSVNIVLNIIAASVIALYQDTLQAVIALAVFLPMISDMSGCSGNQAVAVSMRELTLGLVRPHELLRVLAKELGVGVVNGLALGALLGVLAALWKGNPFLGLVVGGALAINTLVAVSVGGLLPLVLKKLRLDPALVSGPLLTTVTDMCGFFCALSLATVLLSRLAVS